MYLPSQSYLQVLLFFVFPWCVILLFNITKKGREKGSLYQRRNIQLDISLFTFLARNLRLVLELFMNCVCITDTTVLLYQLFSPLYSSQSKTHQAAHHHHSIQLLLLPPSSVLPFRVWRKTTFVTSRRAVDLRPQQREAASLFGHHQSWRRLVLGVIVVQHSSHAILYTLFLNI